MRVKTAIAINAVTCVLISSANASSSLNPITRSAKEKISQFVRESAANAKQKYFTKEKAEEFALEHAVDSAADHVADKITDFAAAHIGGPFVKGHDREMAHEVIDLMINPFEWVEGPAHTMEVIAKLSESAPTESGFQNVPGAHVDPSTGVWVVPGEHVQPISPETKANPSSSSASNSANPEWIGPGHHEGGPLDHGREASAPSTVQRQDEEAQPAQLLTAGGPPLAQAVEHPAINAGGSSADNVGTPARASTPTQTAAPSTPSPQRQAPAVAPAPIQYEHQSHPEGHSSGGDHGGGGGWAGPDHGSHGGVA